MDIKDFHKRIRDLEKEIEARKHMFECERMLVSGLQRNIREYQEAFIEIGPWLSASLSRTVCGEYEVACNKVLRIAEDIIDKKERGLIK